MPKANAAYDAGRIIDDSVFLDAKSMGIADIQNFLNARGSGLKDMTFTLQCYGSSSQERQWYTAAGARCDTPIPASEIIYYAAQIYGVNPKVILATMQKEQSLTTAANPTVWQLTQAMGYACPTSGSCDSSSSFPYQIDSGTWALRFHYERARGNMNWWYTSTSWTCGTEKDLYKPNLYPGQNVRFYDTNGSYYTTVYIQNAATSTMYCYTPHAYNNPQGLYGRAPYGTTGLYYSGSYNFVYFYELWFGTTQTPSFAWQLVSQDAYADAARTRPIDTTVLSPNTTYYLRITAKNTGNVTWSNTGGATNNRVNLGVNNPSNRASILGNNTWLSSSRPATLSESSVIAGATGTFVFSVTTPNYQLSTNEYFNLVAEGQTWMNDIGMHWPIGVKGPTDAYRLTTQEAFYDPSLTKTANTSLLARNTSYYLRIRMLNTGNTTWSNSGANPLRLGTSGPLDRASVFYDSSWISTNRTATMLESSVGPGQVATFVFKVHTPNYYIDQREYFRPVLEGKSWLTDIGLYYRLNVAPATDQWQLQQQRTFTNETKTTALNTSSVPNKTRYYAVVSVKNTGNTAWSNSGTNPLRLGTSSPLDRASVFYDSSWVSQNRPATLKESSVAPGDTGTFEFWMTSPYSVDNTEFKEYFRPVIEGKNWLTDIGMYFYTKSGSSPVDTWSLVEQSAFSNAARTVSADLTNAARSTTYYLRLRILNTTGSTWSTSTFRLGTSSPADRVSAFQNSSWLSSNRATRLKEQSVTPGQVGTLEFSITTPGASTTSNEYFRPVIDGVRWMQDIGLYWRVQVN